MTWPAFFKWLEQNGVKYHAGDAHYAGRGYWYPVPPAVDGTPDPKPPEPWISVGKVQGEDAVFVDTSFEVEGSRSTFAETPEAAQHAVELALMQFDSLGFSGFGETTFPKTCSCGRSFTEADWDELPLLGKQQVEADGDDPACVFVAKNCPCGSTLMVEEPVEG